MSDEPDQIPDDPSLTELEGAIRTAPQAPVPEDLLARCLATIPVPQARPQGPGALWLKGLAKTAAAILVVVTIALLLAGPRHADAVELLQAARSAWIKVPASHEVVRILGVSGARTEETWFVRHEGMRKETRVGTTLIGVIVRNSRWEFHWDVPGGTVAAWSTELAPSARHPADEGLVLDRADFEAWAKRHRSEIAIEADMLEGRAAQKVVLRWPWNGASGKAFLSTTVWFDPETHLPLRQRSEDPSGLIVDTTIDYPPAGGVAGDLFTFKMPRDVVLEVNDPDLGRQLYSDRPSPGTASVPATHTQGDE